MEADPAPLPHGSVKLDGTIKTVREVMYQHIKVVLRFTGGNRTLAAKFLGMKYRTLRYYIKNHDEFEEFRAPPPKLSYEYRNMLNKYPYV